MTEEQKTVAAGARPHGWGDSVVETLKHVRMERPEWIVLAVAAALMLSMVDKAVTIDDPLFIWVAHQVQIHPADPYGFTANWFGYPEKMTINVQNPPLTSYWLAAGGLISWDERWLHLWMLPWALLALWGTMRLARQCGADAFMAGLLTLGTSAFLVSATNLMCDVMMLALMVWSVALWIEGLERQQWSLLVYSGLLAAAALLTKYFALGIVPLLFAYTLIRRRGSDRALWALLIPVAAAAAWHFYTLHLYGFSHLTGAIDYTKSLTAGFDNSLTRLYAAIAGLGGCLAWPIVFSRIRWGAAVLAAAGAMGGAVGLWWLTCIDRFLFPSVPTYFMAAAFGAAGLVVLYLALHDVMSRQRNPEAWLLALWTGGTILFFALLNWTVSARNILPLVPPVAIVAVLALAPQKRSDVEEDNRANRMRKVLLGIAAGLGLAVALVAAWTDYAWADGVRARTADIVDKYSRNGRTVYFMGHWGFQYYMEAQGAAALDLRVLDYGAQVPWEPGACIVIPVNNTNSFPRLPEKWIVIESINRDRRAFGLYLTDPYHGAGFYAHLLGPLPFAWAPVLSDGKRSSPDVYLVKVPPPKEEKKEEKE